MAKSKVEYPAVKEIFTRELRRLGKSVSIIFDSMDASGSTLSNYLNGKRPIPLRILEKMVACLEPDDQGKQLQLQREIEKALRSPTAGNLLEEIKSGCALNVTGIANYLPICGGQNAFFDRFARRFSDLIGIPFNLQSRSTIGALDHLTNNLHMALFDCPDRMLHLRFFRFPLRMTLGVIADAEVLKKSNVSKDTLAQVMSNPESKNLIKRGIRPTVVAGEVGAIHCKKRLKISTLSEVATGLDISKIVGQFDIDIKDWRAGGAIPVTCTDEFTAVRIAEQLKSRCISIFPLASRRAAQTNPTSRDLPQYYASIAINRVDETKSFYFFLLDAFSQFLSTEVETMANWWADLSAELTRIAADSLDGKRDYPSRWAEAWEWIQYVMHLDKESIASYNDSNRLPWRPILKRARQLVRQSFVDDVKGILDRQVIHAMRPDEEESPKRSVGEKLETLFDVSFGIGYDFNKASKAQLTKDLVVKLLTDDMLGLSYS